MSNQVLFHGQVVTTTDYPALLELYDNRRQYRNGHPGATRPDVIRGIE
jgi:hypothetical protein